MLRFILSALLLVSASAFAPTPVGRQSSSALGVAIDTSDIKNGMTIELEGEPYKILSFSIMKQARGAAKTTIKFKNLMRGNTLENTYISGKKLETAQIDKVKHVYTYEDGNTFFFMNSETFEEIPVDSKVVESQRDWLTEGMEIQLVFFKGNVIELILPKTMVFEIVETEPTIKGSTAQGLTKPAVLSCGATITVPGYLTQGEEIKVDTEKRAFLERANK